jgi:ribosomal protein S1
MSEQICFSVTGFKDDVRIEQMSQSLINSNVDEVDVLITDVNHGTYFIKGSISAMYENMAHENMKSLKKENLLLLRALNPAGYDVELENCGVTLSGFMPNTLAGINKLYDPTSIIGETFQVMIESFSEYEGTYIVSRRKYLQSYLLK